MTTDATFVASTDFVLTITAEDQAGNAIDLTGASIRWVLAAAPGGTELVVKTTGGGGVAVTDAENGVFTVTLTDTDTADLDGVYYQEARITDSSGNVTRLRRENFSPSRIRMMPAVGA